MTWKSRYAQKVACRSGPDINISRVEHRLRTGGHSVPKDKITSRYHRPLGLLNAAVACSDRACVFDNSCNEGRVWVAEVTDGNELTMKTDQMPYWFKTALYDPFLEPAPEIAPASA